MPEHLMRVASDQPFLTHDLAPTGGVIKAAPEDFIVEERPLYEPDGAGEHLFLWVEKRGITTFDMVTKLAARLGVSPRNIGYAGLKDAKAVTRQFVSVSGVPIEKARGLVAEEFRVLDATPHSHKLRTGHLKGNHFRATVRAAGREGMSIAREVLSRLEKKGVPNLYGPQRFGVKARSAVVGAALLRKQYRRAIQAFLAPCRPEEGSSVNEARVYAWKGAYNRSLGLFPQSFVPERSIVIALRQAGLVPWPLSATKGQQAKVLRAVPKRYLEFYVSALQAALFNEVLLARFETLDRVFAGDLAWIHSKGAVFAVEDAAAEASRADSLEISPSGPIFGYKVPYATGCPGEIEWAVLKKARLLPRDFRMRLGLKNKGVRRPLRVPITDVSVEPAETGFTAAFSLPKGSYATIVLREILKPDSWDALV